MPNVYVIPDISCVLCFEPIRTALNQQLKLDDVSFDPLQKEISIRIPLDRNQAECERHIANLMKKLHHSPEPYSHRFKGFLGAFSGALVMLLPLIGGPLPMVVLIPVAILSSLLTVILGAHSYQRARTAWKSNDLTMDSLFVMSSFIVLLVSIGAFFVPWLPMMWDTGLLIFGFRHLGLALEASLIQKTQVDVLFSDRLPNTVRIKKTDSVENRPLHQVVINDILVINEGETIPLDGVCLSDNSLIIDTLFTGSSFPHTIKKNAFLRSGMTLAKGGGPLLLLVTTLVEDSYLQKLDTAIAMAHKKEQAEYKIWADKVLRYFIPAVFIFSGVSAVVLSCFFPWATAIQCAVAVLVSACPCTLGMVVPLAVKIGLHKAASFGIQFSSAEQLQRAGEVNAVVFDLNGTLTTGEYRIGHPVLIDDSPLNRAEFLKAIAALEKNARHRLGAALYAHTQLSDPNDDAIPIQESHSGVMGRLDDKAYVLGNLDQMRLADVDLSDAASAEEGLQAGDEVIYLASEGKLIGYVVVSSPIRQDVLLAFLALKKMGHSIFMCTGSGGHAASRCAKALDIEAAHVQSSIPNGESKAAFIVKLKKEGYKVAMVGDSGNDSLAMSESHFGVAIQSVMGDPGTVANAGLVIDGSSLKPLITALQVANQTVRNIKQNLCFSLGYNIVAEVLMGGLLATYGMMVNPSVGVVLMFLQMGLILANAIRFQRQSLSHLKNWPSETKSAIMQPMEPSYPSPREGLYFPPIYQPQVPMAPSIPITLEKAI